MTKIIAFTSDDELTELTGLTYEELWDNGFNLDDWDIGFQVGTKIDNTNLWWLELTMSNYCVGYDEIQYRHSVYEPSHKAME